MFIRGQSLYGTKFIRGQSLYGTEFIRGQSLYGDKVYTGQSLYGDKVYTNFFHTVHIVPVLGTGLHLNFGTRMCFFCYVC